MFSKYFTSSPNCDAIPSTAKSPTSPLPFIEFFMETLYLQFFFLRLMRPFRCMQQTKSFIFISRSIYHRAAFSREKLLFVSLFSQNDLPEKGQPKVVKIFARYVRHGFCHSTPRFVSLCGLTRHTALIKLRKVIITWLWKHDPVDKVRPFKRLKKSLLLTLRDLRKLHQSPQLTSGSFSLGCEHSRDDG